MELTAYLAYDYIHSISNRNSNLVKFTIRDKEYEFVKRICSEIKDFDFRVPTSESTILLNEICYFFVETRNLFEILNSIYDWQTAEKNIENTRKYYQNSDLKHGVEQFFALSESLIKTEKFSSIEFTSKKTGKGDKISIKSPELIKFICEAIITKRLNSEQEGDINYLHFKHFKDAIDNNAELNVIGYPKYHRKEMIDKFVEFCLEETRLSSEKNRFGKIDRLGAKLFFEAGVPFYMREEGRSSPIVGIYDTFNRDLIKQFGEIRKSIQSKIVQ